MKPIFGALRRSAATENAVRELSKRVGRHKENLTEHQDRLVKHRERLDTQRADIASLRVELKRQAQVITDQRKTITRLRDDLQSLIGADNLRSVDWGRALHQLGALETRVGRLEETVEKEEFAADDSSVAEAKSLVDTVRREHDQVRVRFQVISSYEERMRRLEAAVVNMYDGDMRSTL